MKKKKKRTNDFKVKIKYVKADEKEAQELSSYLQDWVYKVLFTGEYRKSKKY